MFVSKTLKYTFCYLNINESFTVNLLKLLRCFNYCDKCDRIRIAISKLAFRNKVAVLKYNFERIAINSHSCLESKIRNNKCTQ